MYKPLRARRRGLPQTTDPVANKTSVGVLEEDLPTKLDHVSKSIPGIGTTSIQPSNIYKKTTDFGYAKLKSQTTPTDGFSNSQYAEFEFNNRLGVDIPNHAYINITIKNNHSAPVFMSPSYEFIDRIECSLNGADKTIVYHTPEIQELLQLWQKDNARYSAHINRFYDGYQEPGVAYNTTNVPMKWNTLGTYVNAAPGPGEEKVDLLNSNINHNWIGAGASKDFQLDVSWLPFFTGHLLFPMLGDNKPRISIYFRTTAAIQNITVGSANTNFAPAGTWGDLFWNSAAANVVTKASNTLLEIQNLEMFVFGELYDTTITESFLNNADSLTWNGLIPQRVIIKTEDNVYNVYNQGTLEIHNIYGHLAALTVRLFNNASLQLLGITQARNGILAFTWEQGGRTLFFQEAPAEFAGSIAGDFWYNDYFIKWKDYNQHALADPAYLGMGDPNGAVNNASQEYTFIGFNFCEDPLCAYWDGKITGYRNFDNTTNFSFTPGSIIGDQGTSFLNLDLYVTGWIISTFTVLEDGKISMIRHNEKN